MRDLVYKENHPPFLKQSVNVFDLGTLGEERTFQNNCYHHYHTERRES